MYSLVAIFSLTYITTILGLSRTLATDGSIDRRAPAMRC